jgi:hypothetical protein
MRNPPSMTMSVKLGPHRFARLRDGTPVLAPLTATFVPQHPARDWPPIELEVDIHADGHPVVTRVSLLGTTDQPLLSNAVRNYSLEKLMAVALSDTVLRVLPAGEQSPTLHIDIGDGYQYVWDRSEDAWERVVSAVRQREVVGRDRLEEVARLYGLGGVKAVKENLHRSASQAYRLVKLAREQGYLEEDDH